jgi:hypothetical protein
VELEVALRRAEQDLEKTRRQSADLYVTCRQQQDDLTALQLQAAGMLTTPGDGTSTRALSQVLRCLEEANAAQARLATELQAFGQYLTTVLDVLQPSESLRSEVMARYRALTKVCEQTGQLPSIVAGRGGKPEGQRESRVMAVNDDLQVVIIDTGSNAGIHPGALLGVWVRDKVVARLRVTEVRPALCAAVPIAGGLRGIAPGAQVRAVE